MRILLTVCFLLGAPTGLEAQLAVPANDGWVTDLAGLLDSGEERQLEQLMESYRSGTGHDVALLTIPSLEGDSLDGFALRVAREWKIGQADLNDGVLLLVSRDDRLMRIEVGRGLEGDLTDSIAGRIIRHVLKPEFQRGRYDDGLEAGVRAIHAAIGGDYGPVESAARRDKGGLMGTGVFLVIFILMMAFARGRMGRGPGGRGSMWPWLLGGYYLGGLGHRRGGYTGGGFTGGGGFGGGGFGGGGFSGFGGGGGFSGGGASGGW